VRRKVWLMSLQIIRRVSFSSTLPAWWNHEHDLSFLQVQPLSLSLSDWYLWLYLPM
jgi:hypothetical protein